MIKQSKKVPGITDLLFKYKQENRLLKTHIRKLLNNINRVTCPNRHGNKIPESALLSDLQEKYHE